MYSYVERRIEKEELGILRIRGFWPFEFMARTLYTEKTRKQHARLFGDLSRFSHASIRGAFKDFEYSSPEVEDCLNVVLSLAYGNVQMVSEGFFGFLDPSLKNVIRKTLFEIADFQGEIGLFEPDKEGQSQKIKLAKGNFMKILK
jgi:hypothetical protein